DGTVHGRAHHGQLEPEPVELPADVNVVRVARAPTGNDGNVVQPISLTAGLADTDVDFHENPPPRVVFRPRYQPAARARRYPARRMTPRWTIVDFVLVVLGGIGGSLALGTVALVLAEPGSDLAV